MRSCPPTIPPTQHLQSDNPPRGSETPKNSQTDRSHQSPLPLKTPMDPDHDNLSDPLLLLLATSGAPSRPGSLRRRTCRRFSNPLQQTWESLPLVNLEPRTPERMSIRLVSCRLTNISLALVPMPRYHNYHSTPGLPCIPVPPPLSDRPITPAPSVTNTQTPHSDQTSLLRDL